LFDLTEAPAGRCSLVVRDSSTGDSGSADFVVLDAQATPEKVSVDALLPNSGAQGEDKLPVEVYGLGLEKDDVIYLGQNIIATPLQPNEKDILVTTLKIPADAPPGNRTVLVYDSTGKLRATGPANFDVRSADRDPVVNQVFPPTGKTGPGFELTINGENLEDPVEVLLGEGIQVGNVRALNSHIIKADITIAAGAGVGYRIVSVKTKNGSAPGTKEQGFFVEDPGGGGGPKTPKINAVAPSSGKVGEKLKNVKITGSNFQTGAGVSFGPNIKANNYKVVDDDEIQIEQLDLSKATVGRVKVKVNNPGEGGETEADVFEVKPKQQ
jgi:hypothetical protein